MATSPLTIGAITACKWEGMGTMLLRDNTGNGNLIWISQSAALDIRISIDEGKNWSEPTALGADARVGSTWAQDSAGNLHGILPDGISNAVYRKITLTRTSGDITSTAETTTLTLTAITDSACGRSWSIAIINDGQTSAKERVAIAWIDGKFSGAAGGQRLSVKTIITTRAAGVSPTLVSDFMSFDEGTITGELLRTSTGGASGTSTGFCTKIAQMPSTAGTAKYNLYVATRMYDTSDVSERLIEIFESTWSGVGSASAISFVVAGALAANATTVTLAVVAPTVRTNDIMICSILQKANQVISAPDGTWTKFVAGATNTANQQLDIFWKVATAANSGATFNFTKPVDDNLLFCGVISAYRGCNTTNPIDATTPTTSPNASSDTVTYATFDPTQTNGAVVAIGVYNNDLTTAGAISGTNPTFANNFDLETATGSDGSIFGYLGQSDGAATGARSHSTTSTADDINIGCLFGLVRSSEPTAPAWGAFASKSTGSTPAETAIHNIDLLVDSTNNRIIFCGSDTTSLTTKTLDIWVIDSSGTLDKNTTFAQINYGSIANYIRSGKLFIDKNGALWAIIIENSLASGTAIGLAYYSGGIWNINYVSPGTLSNIIDDIVVCTNNSGKNRIFWAFTDTVDLSPLVCSSNLTSESLTIKTAGGTFDSIITACQYTPELMLNDYTLTIFWKSGGWNEPVIIGGGTIGGIVYSSNTIISGVKYTVDVDPETKHNGIWDTSKVYINNTTLNWSVNIGKIAGAGKAYVKNLQASVTSTSTAYNLAAFRSSSMGSGSLFNFTGGCIISNCLFLSQQDINNIEFNVYFTDSSSTTPLNIEINNCILFQYNTNLGAGAASYAVYFAILNSASNIKINNCVIYESQTHANPGYVGFLLATGSAASPIVKNCIYSHTSTNTAVTMAAFYDTDGTQTFGTSTNNAMSNSNGVVDSLDIIDNQPIYYAYTTAQVAYVDAANKNLHISPTSTLVDKGILISTFSDDFEGRPRLLGKWDIGAHEVNPVWLNRKVIRQNTLLRM